jgi:hypothetical protein
MRRMNSDNACYHSKNVKIRKYKTIILPVVLYGCDNWSLTLREEHRLKVFENRVLRTIFGLKRDEVTGKWRKLHNNELCDLYSLPSVIRIIKLRMRWMGNVARMGGKGTCISYWWESRRRKRPLGRPRPRWVGSWRGGMGRCGLDWSGSGTGGELL